MHVRLGQLRSVAVGSHWVHAGKGVAAEVQLPDSSPQAHRLAAAFHSSAPGEAGGRAGAGPARALQAVLGNAAMVADAGVAMPPVAQQHVEDLEVCPCSVPCSVFWSQVQLAEGKVHWDAEVLSRDRRLIIVRPQAAGSRSPH